MVTSKNIKEIYKKLIENENLCRLLYYGENALDVVENIHDRKDFDELMRRIVNFSPQSENVADSENCILFLFKGYTNLQGRDLAIRKEQIEIGLLVPHRLQQQELRVYELENKIVEILDYMPITGLGNLKYTDGHFMKSPVDKFCYYRMLFDMCESRGTGMYGR